MGEMVIPSDGTVKSVSSRSSSAVSFCVGPLAEVDPVSTSLYEGGAPEVALFPAPLLPPIGVSWTHHCCYKKMDFFKLFITVYFFNMTLS